MSFVAATKRLIAEERLGAVVTVVEGPGTGAKAVLDFDDGIIAGELPASLAEAVLADSAELMDREQSRTLTYDETSVFIETIAPQPLMMIFGAGHNAQPLTKMAKELGFKVVVGDARPMWATEERFPDADEVIVGWPDAVFEKTPLDRRTYVVLLSHDPRFEDPVFAEVHGKPVKYLGSIGSRRTHRARLERLAAAGWTQEELDAIYGPIGLDIGAETPAEMAVSILGEIVQARYGGGSGLSLRGETGRVHKQRGEEEGTA
ncbi:MAG: XdhC/CoxI family protein [Acidimicrobiia bacterium]|nr:XdhC/CoxI family protein [Acidimicrobiia bacterium]